jgi:hypothetical protein
MKIFRVARDGDVMPHGHHVFHMPALVFAHLGINAIPAIGFAGGEYPGMLKCGLRLSTACFCEGQFAFNPEWFDFRCCLSINSLG